MLTPDDILPDDLEQIDSEELPNQGHLLRNMVLFGRLLRELGIEVTPTQILDLVAGLDVITLNRRIDFKNMCRALLVNRHEHLALFDRAFDLFWQARDEDLTDVELGSLLRKTNKKREEVISSEEIPPDSKPQKDREEEPEIEEVYTYSNREVLKRKDFGDLAPDELDEIKKLMKQMSWKLERRRTRRKERAPHGIHLDMRRTFRQNLRHGGEMLELTWRQRKQKRRPLVVIADISGSMERYSRILLKFIYVISSGLEKVEAFVFSTRLTRITRQLKERNIDTALDQATSVVEDWGGGTRIGEALKTFNYEWGRRVLGQGAIVIIISDGWDRGDVDLLEDEMQRLQLSCQRLIWLNPLLGSENYEPLTRGIQAAMPYIDDFMPVHNLKSLEQLGKLLEKLGEHRPVREQRVTSG